MIVRYSPAIVWTVKGTFFSRPGKRDPSRTVLARGWQPVAYVREDRGTSVPLWHRTFEGKARDKKAEAVSDAARRGAYFEHVEGRGAALLPGDFLNEPEEALWRAGELPLTLVLLGPPAVTRSRGSKGGAFKVGSSLYKLAACARLRREEGGSALRPARWVAEIVRPLPWIATKNQLRSAAALLRCALLEIDTTTTHSPLEIAP